MEQQSFEFRSEAANFMAKVVCADGSSHVLKFVDGVFVTKNSAIAEAIRKRPKFGSPDSVWEVRPGTNMAVDTSLRQLLAQRSKLFEQIRILDYNIHLASKGHMPAQALAGEKTEGPEEKVVETAEDLGKLNLQGLKAIAEKENVKIPKDTPKDGIIDLILLKRQEEQQVAPDPPSSATEESGGSY